MHDNQNNQTTITMRQRPCCCRACLTNEQQQYNPDITNSTDPKPCQHGKMNGTPFQVTHHLSGNQNHVNLTKHALIQNQIDFMKNVLSLTLQKRKDVPIKLKKKLFASDRQTKRYKEVFQCSKNRRFNKRQLFGILWEQKRERIYHEKRRRRVRKASTRARNLISEEHNNLH